MLATIVRRLLQTIVVMLVMSALVFAGIYMVGDPVSMLASPEATEAQRAAIRASLGLDLPLWRQYLIFMGQAVRGDFGNSFLTGEPAMRLILERMPATVELACVAMLLSVLIGVPLGMIVATGALWCITTLVGAENFMAWGWRISFLLSIALIIVGVFIRRAVEESPVFLRMQSRRSHS
ncbi:ABC transporter permease, partial [Escherichia coli]|uniref:ABC transporter permease n=1 Tax=Escherichia coli TaxID=562 RepID=UPI00331309F7